MQRLVPHGPLTPAHLLGTTSRIGDPTGLVTRAIPKGSIGLIVDGTTYEIHKNHGPRQSPDFAADAAVWLFKDPEHRKRASTWLASIAEWCGVPIDRLPEGTLIKARSWLELRLDVREPDGEITAFLSAPGAEPEDRCSGTRVIPDDSVATVVACVASMLGVPVAGLLSVIRIQGVTGTRDPKRQDGRGLLLGSQLRWLQVSFIRECGKCGAKKKLVHTSSGARVQLTLCLPCARTRVRALSGGHYVLSESKNLEIVGSDGAAEPTGNDAVMIAVLLSIQRASGIASPFAKLLAEMPRFADLVAKPVLYKSEWGKFRVLCGVKRKLMECKAKLQGLEGPGYAEFASDMRRLVAIKAAHVDVFEAAEGHLRKRCCVAHGHGRARLE
jgi:hypothetical protein